MTGDELSPTDAALRERLTELSVHIPCGRLRGPLQTRNRFHPELPVLWQSCRDEDSPARWVACDVSEDRQLCIVCFRGTAGGRSRWSWLACEHCRDINAALESAWGFKPLALGRHSLMNGIGIRGGVTPQVRDEQAYRLSEFARGHQILRDWRDREYSQLASAFDPLADIPLREWQGRWPASRTASLDAFSRILLCDLPFDDQI